jgi:putative phage-type endonuclease
MFKTYFKETHENLRGSDSGIAGVVRISADARRSKRCCYNHGNESLAHEATTLAGEVLGLEEQARNAYILQTGRLVLPMVATCEVHPFISASFDGVSDDFKNIVEIKCGKASHKLAQHGELPRYYMAQVQQQMYVAGVQEMDYFSYNQIIKPDHSFVEDKIIIPVTLDYEFVETLIEKIKEFWHCVQTNTPPKD